MNSRILGWSDLRENIETKDLGFICPVAGCQTRLTERQRGHFVFDAQYRCSTHEIVFSPSTFQYEKAERNILWDFDLLESHMVSKRESRIARDNSEDAVTWNVFRFLERHGLLIPYLSELAKPPLTTTKSIYWSHDQDKCKPWEPLMDGRREFDFNPSKGSEPDLIVLTDQCLFFIEAKLMATNKTKPTSPRSREKYVTGGNGWWKTAFTPGSDYSQIAEAEQKYELLRFWLIGTWMAKQLNVDFRLVNLLRDQDEDEKDIEDRFGKHLPADLKGKFLRRTWEDICRFIQSQAPDSAEQEKILRYFREKTVGYRNGALQKAFAV
jgi:hypothetical protein